MARSGFGARIIVKHVKFNFHNLSLEIWSLFALLSARRNILWQHSIFHIF